MTEQKQNLADIARKKRYLYLVEKLHTSDPLSKQEILELEGFEAEPLEPTIVKTMEEVAKVMEVSYRTVQRWKKDGMPTTQDGFYDLAAIKTWHDERIGEADDEEESKTFWDINILKKKASLLDLKLRKEEGELISREEVEKDMIEKIIAAKRAFLALPTRLAPVLAMKEPREIEAVLYESIGEIIDEFAGVKPKEEPKEETKQKPNQESNADNKPDQRDLEPKAEKSLETSGEDNSQPVGG